MPLKNSLIEFIIRTVKAEKIDDIDEYLNIRDIINKLSGIFYGKELISNHVDFDYLTNIIN